MIQHIPNVFSRSFPRDLFHGDRSLRRVIPTYLGEGIPYEVRLLATPIQAVQR